MTTTSTEYAITKRGMSPHLRKRDKPLRTYGKRPHNNGDEPPTKKRRCSSADEGIRDEKLKARDQHVTATNAGKGAELEQPVKSKEAEEIIKGPKGSILSYFKRVEVKTAKSEKIKSSEEEAEAEGEESPRPARRKPRLLRLRATSTTDTEPLPPLRKKRRPPLEECSAGNRQDAAAETKKKKKKKQKKATAAATTVQTVLNISPQAAFSECRLCDTVWNPLWPDDVKYHLKRHAAAVGRRKREEEKLL